MAKDISANAELSGGKIEASLSLSNNKLTADADIHGLIPVKGKSTQADWNETDSSSDAYIKNKPTIPSLDGYATQEWVEEQNYLTEHQDISGKADIDLVDEKIAAILPTDTASGAVASFPDGADDVPLTALNVNIDPVQDLNGYDNPWPAGGSSQLLPTYTEDKTVNGVTLTVNKDGSVTINGTATATTTLDAPVSDWQWDGTEECWLSGCPAGGNSSTGYSLRVDCANACSQYDIGAGIQLKNYTTSIANKPLFFRIVIRSGTACNNLVFKPMLNKGLSAQSFTPYSNICPISGWEKMDLSRCGENLWRDEWYSVGDAMELVTDPDDIYYGYYGGAIQAWHQSLGPITRQLFRDGIENLTVSADVGNKTSGSSSFKFQIYFVYSDGTYGHTGNLSVAPNDKKRVTATSSSGKKCTGFYISTSAGVTNFQGRIKSIMVSTNGTTEYTAPKNEIFSIPFGQTVYGGVLDVLSGKLTIEMTFINLDEVNWSFQEAVHSWFIELNKLPVLLKQPANDAVPLAGIEGKCSTATVRSYSGTTSSNSGVIYNNNSIGIRATVARLYFRTDGTNQIRPSGVAVLPMANPIEIQLEPHEVNSLLGTNNIFADTGDTTAEYKANIQLYIQKKISEALN